MSLTTTQGEVPSNAAPSDVPRTPVDASPARARWVDDSRGIGIVLVVLGHAIGGILSAGIADPDGGYSTAFQSIYSFHMPVFFLLSGLFCRRYERGEPGAHVIKSARRILYPYVVWSIVTLTVISSLGTLVNRPFNASWLSYAAILWAPPAQLWFLYGLFALNLVYILLLRTVGAGTLFVLALLARFVPMVFHVPDVVGLTATYALFFAGGALLTTRIFARIESMNLSRTRQAAAASAILWLIAFLVARAGGIDYLGLAMLLASIFGTCAVVFTAVALARTRAADVLGYLGRISMPIYLLHVLFVAGTRIVLVKFFHFETPSVLLPVLVISGIVGPIVVYEVSKRVRLAGALGFE